MRRVHWWVIVGLTLSLMGLLILLVARQVKENRITDLSVPSKCGTQVCSQSITARLTINCNRSEMLIDMYNPNPAQAQYGFTYDETSSQGLLQPGWNSVASVSVSQGQHSVIFNMEDRWPVTHDFSC